MKPVGPQKLRADHQRIIQPLRNRFSGSFRYLKSHWFLRFELKHRGSFFHLARRIHIGDFHSDQIATSKFAINSRIEQSQVVYVYSDLKSSAG